MGAFLSFFTWNLLSSSIRLTTPILLAALAAALCNKAGVLNLAIEGEMLLGAFVAIVVSYLVRKYTGMGKAHAVFATSVGVAASLGFGMLLGWFMASIHSRYHSDLVIFSIAFNMLSSEITVYIMRSVFHQNGTWTDPSLVQLPAIGEYNIIVYLSWILTVVLIIVFHKTVFGRHLKAVGEAPEAAASVGISVKRVHYVALIAGGMLACLGGAFLSVGHLILFTRDMSSGRGWLGNAAALFGFNNPGGTFLASLFFGFADAVALRLQNVTKIPPYIIQLMPYVLTLVILSVVSFRAKKKRSKNALY